MGQRGWSQWRFAEEIGVDRSWVTRALIGERDPGFSKVVDALGRAGYKLVLVDDPSDGDGNNVRRRRFLVELGTVVGVSQLSVAVPLTYGAGDLRDASEVRAAAQRYVKLEREFGGGVVYGPAARVAQMLVRRVRSERVSAAYRQAVGWYVHEVAWLAYDAGQRRATRTYGSQALELARRTQDRPLQARAYNLLSLAATSVRDGKSGAEFARRGIAAARDGAEPDRTLLWARLARAEAAQGPERARLAMQALDHADAAAGGDRDVYEAVANRGIVLMQFGNLDEARKPLTEAGDIIGRLGEPRNRCLYVARSAKAAVRQSALEEAVFLIDQVLEEAAGIVSTRIDNHLREWMALTKPPHIAAVTDIREARDRVRDRLAPFALA
ncbi:MAG: hypothetical protein ACRDP6_32420 [Actinoallomurus sp.]